MMLRQVVCYGLLLMLVCMGTAGLAVLFHAHLSGFYLLASSFWGVTFLWRAMSKRAAKHNSEIEPAIYDAPND